jgi:hypothetical protein
MGGYPGRAALLDVRVTTLSRGREFSANIKKLNAGQQSVDETLEKVGSAVALADCQWAGRVLVGRGRARLCNSDWCKYSLSPLLICSLFSS